MTSKKTFGRPSADIELNLEEDALEWVSPLTGKSYVFKLVEINSSQIKQCAHPSPYNHRSNEFLTLADVSDILPTIKENKCNSQPIRAVGTKYNFNVLEGLRRTYCVSTIKDAMLKVLLTPIMDDVDQKHLASVADIYRKPTTIDIALKIKKHELTNKSLSKVAEALNISKTSAFNAKNIIDIPSSLYLLFPGLSYIKTRFLISLKNREDELKEIIPSCTHFSEFLQENERAKHINGELLDEAVYKKVSEKVENEIKEYLLKTPKPVELLDGYSALSTIDGVKVTADKNGNIKLTMSKAIAKGKADLLRAILKG